jgi:flagellar motor switch protein FliG
MSLTGKQKAAMLLLSLDAGTASELVKGLDAKAVQELAVELAYLDASGFKNNTESVEIAQQFCNSLTQEKEFGIDSFLKELLKAAIGEAKAESIQTQIHSLLHKRDPFIPIRSVNSKTLSSVLNNEHPQAIAVVLTELPEKKSSEVLGHLEDNVRFNAISRMARSESVTLEAKTRIAETVSKKLEAMTATKTGVPAEIQPEQQLRKVAVILRNLSKELRDGLINNIKGKDAQSGEEISRQMILWIDIPLVTDRSMQEIMRGIDSRKLALALHKAEEKIIQKIKSSISERAKASLDEETSLMPNPKKEDVASARDEIVNVLREKNEKGELAFIEE